MSLITQVQGLKIGNINIFKKNQFINKWICRVLQKMSLSIVYFMFRISMICVS